MSQQVILNGNMSNIAPDEAVIVNNVARFRPSIINGLMPLDVNINGLTRLPVLPGCVLNLPLYHSALSNPTSFRSLDENKHLCTVTGALWIPNGRLFDGTDDFLNIGDPSVMEALAEGTILMWFKPTANIAVTDNKAFIDKGNTYIGFGYQAGPAEIAFTLFDGGAHNLVTSGVTTWNAGQAYHLALSWGALGQVIYVDGAENNKDAGYTGGFNASATDWNLARNAGDLRYADITIGEFLVYNRQFASLEIQHIYLATRWRYQ